MAKSAKSSKSTPKSNIPFYARIALTLLGIDEDGNTVCRKDVQSYVRDGNGNVVLDGNGNKVLGGHIQAWVHNLPGTDLGLAVAGDGTRIEIPEPNGQLSTLQHHLATLAFVASTNADTDEIVKCSREIVEIEKLKCIASKGDYGFRIEFFAQKA